MDGKTFKLIIALCMMFGAVLVVITCVWKLVKLVAKFKIEGRMEELEQLSKRKSENDDGAIVIVSPEEARKLRRLSILAGFDRKLTKSARSSFSEAVAGLRRPLRLLSAEHRSCRDLENQTNPVSANGKIYSNFLSPESGSQSILSQSNMQATPIIEKEAKDSSPIRHPPKLCAVHGAKQRSATYNLNKSSSPSPPPPPPPPPFASVSECSDSLIRAKIAKPVIIPVHCINPNHYHHFHHHHDAMMNPTSIAATSSVASCIMCHLSSSLFHLHPSRCQSFIVSPCSSMKVEDQSPERSDDDADPEADEDDIEIHDDDEDEDDGEEEEVSRRRELVAGTPPPSGSRSSFCDISIIREPLYSDVRSDIAVHWNGSARCSTPTKDLDSWQGFVLILSNISQESLQEPIESV